MPLAYNGAFMDDGDAGQYLGQAFDPVRGQVDCHADCVDDPAHYDLNDAPGTIPLPQLLERHGLLSMDITVGYKVRTTLLMVWRRIFLVR